MFNGIIVPMITPFNNDYSIDVDALKWLTKYLSSSGVHGLFPVSTTGEFPHLSFGEKIRVTRIVVETAPSSIHVIPGASENSSIHVVELAKKYADLGVDGIVVTTPYYFKYGDEGLYKHFSYIADRVDIPIILYNIPALTGNNISVDLVVKLVEEYSNIVGIKVTYDSMTYLRRLILDSKSVRKDFSVLVGSVDLLLPSLAIGGNGGVLALAHIAPRTCVELYESWVNGEYTRAIRLYQKLVRLARLYDIASSIPSIIKSTLSILGAPIKPVTRPPLTPEPEEKLKTIKTIIDEVKIELGG